MLKCFLTRGNFVLLGSIWQCVETFLIVTTGQCVIAIYSEETEDAAKHSVIHDTAPPSLTKNKNCLVKNANSAEVDKKSALE